MATADPVHQLFVASIVEFAASHRPPTDRLFKPTSPVRD
jgi:hypothetical protein